MNPADLKWWHLALLRALDETNGFTAATIGQAVWTRSPPREAASTATPHLKKLAEWGLVKLLDDQRPMVWLRTPEGTAMLASHRGGRDG